MHARLAAISLAAVTFVTPALAGAQSAPAEPPTAQGSASVRIGTPSDAPPPPPEQPMTVIGAQPPVARPVSAYTPAMYASLMRPTLFRGGPVPPGMHVEQRTFTGLAAGGAGVFGGMYIVTVLAGILASPYGSTGLLYIPVAGPIVWTATQPGAASVPSSVAIMVVDSLVQAAGVAMFIGGLMIRRPWLVPGETTSSRSHHRTIAWTLTGGPATAQIGFGAALMW